MIRNPWVGLGIVAIVVSSVIWFGSYKHNQGYTKAQQEHSMSRQLALEHELEKNALLEQAKQRTEDEYEKLKSDTEVKLTKLGTVNNRLRKQSEEALATRDKLWGEGSGDTSDSGTHWIRRFDACREEYGAMGGDYARTADKLRGLQKFEFDRDEILKRMGDKVGEAR